MTREEIMHLSGIIVGINKLIESTTRNFDVSSIDKDDLVYFNKLRNHAICAKFIAGSMAFSWEKYRHEPAFTLYVSLLMKVKEIILKYEYALTIGDLYNG